MKKLFFNIILLSFIIIYSTDAQCLKQNTTFKNNEVLYYDVQYNCGPVWANAGIVSFRTQYKNYLGKPAYLLTVYGTSLKSYDWMFKVRDLFQAYVDTTTLSPYYFEKRTYEGGMWSHDSYSYDHSHHRVFTTVENKNMSLRKDTLYYNICTYDIVSAVYYARNIDFTKYKVGDKIPISVIIDNKIYNLYVRYLGKETLTLRNGQIYKCLKFSAKLVEGTIFKGGEDLTGWISDDADRIAVMVQAKILIGSVKAVFNRAENLRYPLSSRVK